MESENIAAENGKFYSAVTFEGMRAPDSKGLKLPRWGILVSPGLKESPRVFTRTYFLDSVPN